MKGWSELGKLPRRVWILSAAALVNRFGTMALPFLTLYLTSKLGWTAPRAAGMLALYGGVALVAGPYAGRMSDRFGAARVARLTLVGSGALALVFPLARSGASVAALTVLWALFSEAFRPANMTAVTESAPPELRKPAFALHRAAVNLGMSVGPALGGFLAAKSYNWLWFIDGATCLASAVILWRGLEELEPASAAEREEGPSASALKDRAMLYFLAASLPVTLVFFQLEAGLPLFMTRDLGLSPAAYGMTFTVNTILIVLIEIPLNAATARWPHARTLGLGALLFAVGFGCYGLAGGLAGTLLATAVWTFGEMTLMPGGSAYVAAVSPDDRKGEYMGLYIMTYSVGFTVGPWLGTLVLERFGSGVLWGGCFMVGSLSAWLFSRLREPHAAAAAGKTDQDFASVG
jgi:MFS family permease